MSDFDPFDIASQNTKDNDRRHMATADRKVEAEDWSWLMASKRGRRIVRDLLDQCGVDRSSFTGNSETFFREGQRAIGLHVIRLARLHAPAHYAEMLKDE